MCGSSLWFYGFMVLWFYGYMVIWLYGYMVIWLYGYMVIWLYGYMVDQNCSQAVAKASRTFKFVNPIKAGTLPKLPPVFIVRAGKDEIPGLNGSIDSFISLSLQHNAPVTLLNLPGARHAFDVVDKSAGTQQAIGNILAFFQNHLIR